MSTEQKAWKGWIEAAGERFDMHISNATNEAQAISQMFAAVARMNKSDIGDFDVWEI